MKEKPLAFSPGKLMREIDTTASTIGFAMVTTEPSPPLLKGPRTCQEFISELEASRARIPLEEWPIGKILPVVGLEKTFERKLYATNTSGKFKMGLRNKEGILEEVNLVAVRFDPVEKPEGVGFVGFCFLRNEGTDQEHLEWCPQIPSFALSEDPEIAWIEIDGKKVFILGLVALTYFYNQERHKDPKTTTVFFTDDGTYDIHHLRKFAEILGKDNRLAQLEDGWRVLTVRKEVKVVERKLVTIEKDGKKEQKWELFSRKEKRIGVSLIDPKAPLNQQTIQKAYDEARMFEGFFAPGEWGGITDIHVLPANVERIRLRGGVADSVPATIDIPNPFPEAVGQPIALFHRACYQGGISTQERERLKKYLNTIGRLQRVDHTLELVDEVPVTARPDFPKCEPKHNPLAPPDQLEWVVFLKAMELL